MRESESVCPSLLPCLGHECEGERKGRKVMINVRSGPDPAMEFSGMYEFVRCEVLELNARWIVFKQLFAQGEARVSLLNREVPALFSMFHDAVRDGILMSIAR